MFDFSYFNDTVFLIYAATSLQVLGFLVRQQIILRVMVLCGTALFVLYYYFHLGEPQWAAVMGSSLIGCANLTGLIMLIYSRIPIGLHGVQREMFDAFGTIQPGQFQKLMKIGRLRESTDPIILTREGERSDKLYYVLHGRPRIEKGEASFRIDGRVFIAEIGYYLNVPASATVLLPEGGVIFEWDREKLLKATNRNPNLRQAFDALITRDLAQKVALSIPNAIPVQEREPTMPMPAVMAAG